MIIVLKQKGKKIKIKSFEELKKQMVIYEKLGENDIQSVASENKKPENEKQLSKET